MGDRRANGAGQSKPGATPQEIAGRKAEDGRPAPPRNEPGLQPSLCKYPMTLGRWPRLEWVGPLARRTNRSHLESAVEQTGHILKVLWNKPVTSCRCRSGGRRRFERERAGGRRVIRALALAATERPHRGGRAVAHRPSVTVGRGRRGNFRPLRSCGGRGCRCGSGGGRERAGVAGRRSRNAGWG